MKPFKHLLLPGFYILFLLFLFINYNILGMKNVFNSQPPLVEKSTILEKAAIVKGYLAGKKFNRRYCFLVDMNLPSGRNRFFVFDLSADSIVLSGLVSHGHCKKGFSAIPSFSNNEQSCCTALGRYRVGEHYKGQYGLAYKLYGLDSSNSNAYSRNIVLHAYRCVPEKQTDPIPICNSSGCPMLSPAFLRTLQPYLDKSREPVLLWIFN